MKTLQKSINEALSQWNPIGLPEEIAVYEYRSYVDEIIAMSETLEQTIHLLEDIVSNRMGLPYDKTSPIHKRDLQKVASKIRGRIVGATTQQGAVFGGTDRADGQ